MWPTNGTNVLNVCPRRLLEIRLTRLWVFVVSELFACTPDWYFSSLVPRVFCEPVSLGDGFSGFCVFGGDLGKVGGGVHDLHYPITPLEFCAKYFEIVTARKADEVGAML